MMGALYVLCALALLTIFGIAVWAHLRYLAVEAAWLLEQEESVRRQAALERYGARPEHQDFELWEAELEIHHDEFG